MLGNPTKREQQLHRYCHGIENQLAYALNKDVMAEVLAEHPGAKPQEQAEYVTRAIRERGPLVSDALR